MPRYTIQDPDSGKTVTVEGPQPPTESELTAIFKQASMRTSATAGPAQVSSWSTTAPTQSATGVSQVAPEFAKAIFDAGAEGGGAAAGQMVGAMGGPLDPVTIPLGGAIGGMVGNAIAQKRRMAMAEQPGGFRIGQFLGAGLTGAIPGGPLAKLGKAGLAKEAIKYGAGNIAAKAVETGVDESRLPTAGETTMAGGVGAAAPMVGKALDKGVDAAKIVTKAIQNATRDATLAAAARAGYVIPPSKVNPGMVNNLLESIGGKAATVQEVAVRNQEITNALAKKAIGLPPDAPITETVLRQVREQAAQPYREIEQLAEQGKQSLEALKKSAFTASDPHELAVQMADPGTVKKLSALAIQAGADVNALKKARFDATSNYQFYHRSADPKALETAQAAEELANKLEQQIEDAATQMGNKDLAADLKASRTKIAKAYQIEKALNLADSNVSAPILGRSIDSGTPLTGELATAAKFQQAFPQAAREGAVIPSPGVGKLKIGASAALAVGGYGSMGPAGMAAAALPFMDGPARALSLSKPYQRFMAKPAYGQPQADFVARFGRNSTAAFGKNNFLQFLSEAYPAQPQQ